MVYQLTKPFTLAGKDLLIQKEIRAAYEEYADRSVMHRAWFPKDLPERIELQKHAAEYSHQLNLAIKSINMAYLGVESYIDDYVFAGIRGAGNSRTHRRMVYQWGFEEQRHGDAFRYIEIDSGLMTQAEVDEFLDSCARDRWEFERQTGKEATLSNVTAYTITQERQTKFSYHEFRKFLMAEYQRTGNPLLPPMERIVRYVEIDEGAHEAAFRTLLRILMKYRPDMALESMLTAFSQYTMPIVNYPNKEECEAAIIATGVISLTKFGREVLKPAIEGMGLANRLAIKNAERNVRSLPENALVQIPGKTIGEVPEGAVVYEMSRLGEFSLVS